MTYDAGMSRPLRLTSDEALALVVALQTLADVPGLADGDAVARALGKIEGAAGANDEAAARVTVAVDAQERALTSVREAIGSGRAMHLTYYAAGRDASTERDVDPMRLLFVEGRSYLEAWCRSAEAVRLFRLDRIDDVRLLDEPSQPPTDAAPRDLDGGLFQPAPEDPAVTLRLGPGQAWVADYYPVEDSQRQDDGGLIIILRVTDTAWIRKLTLGGGADVTVVAPSALAAEVRAEARSALAAYGD